MEAFMPHADDNLPVRFLALSSIPLLLAVADVEPFPEGAVYPSPIAGPASRGFGFSRLQVDHVTTTDTGNTFYALKLGSVFNLLGVGEWSLGFDAAFLGLFDVDRSYDNLGWDGNYGVVVARTLGSAGAMRLAWLHTSAHVGDEYLERTGRMRIGYTRQEVALGGSWKPARAWRLYAEYAHGYGYDPDDPGEPGRGQVGIEWERGSRWGPYGALDVQAWQERDWARDVAVQGGIAFRSETRRWRLGIEAYDGRVPLGEFFLEDQRHVAVGLFLDLGEGVLAP
jgi:hypothetical protein